MGYIRIEKNHSKIDRIRGQKFYDTIATIYKVQCLYMDGMRKNGMRK